jgi:lipopolysaccharide biosynthesis glycosyltransferase
VALSLSISNFPGPVMKKNLVLLYANHAYLAHVKSLIVSLRITGKWKGAIGVLSPDIKGDELNAPNCFVRKNNKPKNPHIILSKLDLWGERFLLDWDAVLYMDCDTMCIGDINPLFDTIYQHPNLLFCEPDRNTNKVFTLGDYFPHALSSALDNLKESFTLSSVAFNSGVVGFRPAKVQKYHPSVGTEALDYISKYKDLIPATEESLNSGIQWTDQQPLNMIFNQEWKSIGQQVCFWGLYHNNLINTNHTSILHFFRWAAPWSNDNFCPLFNHTFKEEYNSNLKQYEQLDEYNY